MESAKLFRRENPFPAAPNTDRYVPIGSIETARKRLTDAIDRREGPGLLIGPSGTGKSLLCSLIAATYRDQFDVVLLAEARLCTRRALLQHLLHHLGLPYSDQSEGELRLALIDRAASGGPENHAGLLIIVDEAHTLPSRLLEELRMMSGIVRHGNPRVQMVLAGGPSLDERFAHPRMEAFSQRIGTRCYLHPLGQLDTGKYIREAIRQAGADPQMIDEEAIGAVYYAADGIPRLINQTMRRSVALAEAEGQRRITAEIVQRAWADLQQLPSPISGPASAAASAPSAAVSPTRDIVAESVAMVEFGALEDDDADQVAQPTWEPLESHDPLADTVDYEPRQGQLREDVAEAGGDESIALDTREEVVSMADLHRGEQLACESPAAEVNHCVEGGECREDCQSPQLCPRAIASCSTEMTAGATAEALVAADVISLFGDGFEDEEPLSTGFASSGSPTVDSRLATAEQDEAENVEREIHREIVSINTEALRSEPQFLFQTSVQDDRPVSQAPAAKAECAASGGDITVQDDSYLLVIEDDVELDARRDEFPPRGPRAPAAPADEISLQSMFSRLREG